LTWLCQFYLDYWSIGPPPIQAGPCAGRAQQTSCRSGSRQRLAYPAWVKARCQPGGQKGCRARASRWLAGESTARPGPAHLGMCASGPCFCSSADLGVSVADPDTSQKSCRGGVRPTHFLCHYRSIFQICQPSTIPVIGLMQSRKGVPIFFQQVRVREGARIHLQPGPGAWTAKIISLCQNRTC
jgi:hypothetical protein